MYSAQRLKKRYIVFSAKAAGASANALSEEDVRRGLHAFLLRFFGEFGYSKLSFKLLQYEPAKSMGLIRCERGTLSDLLGALALVEEVNGKKARLIALASSGTIKTLREKVLIS